MRDCRIDPLFREPEVKREVAKNSTYNLVAAHPEVTP